MSIAVASGRNTASGGGSGGNGSGSGGGASNDDDDDDDGDDDEDDDDDVVILNPTSTTTTTTTTTAATSSPSDILNHRRACFACIITAPQPTDDHVTVRIGSSTAAGHADATIVTRVPLELICPPLTIEQVLQALQHFNKDEALVNITR